MATKSIWVTLKKQRGAQIYSKSMVYFKSKTLPVGRTMVIHNLIGSFQKSFIEVDVCPKQNLIIVKKPRRTVVSRCFVSFPNNWQICWSDKNNISYDTLNIYILTWYMRKWAIALPSHKKQIDDSIFNHICILWIDYECEMPRAKPGANLTETTISL